MPQGDVPLALDSRPARGRFVLGEAEPRSWWVPVFLHPQTCALHGKGRHCPGMPG